MAKAIRQSDLIGPKKAEAVIQEVEKNLNVPLGYASVNLASDGLLTNGISKIHIRNFTMAELMDITAVREENQTETLLKVLNDLIFEEDINALDLHEKDIEVIMATIKANWWDRYLRDIPYLKNLDGSADDPENIGRVDIAISSLPIKDLNPQFKEPIAITVKEGLNAGKTVYFTLPRIGTLIKAKTLAIESNREKYNKMKELQMVFSNKNKQLTSAQYETLDTLSREYQNLIQKYFQAQLIWGNSPTPFTSIEEKPKALTELDAQFWVYYAKAVSEQCQFGFEEEVTFDNPDAENDPKAPKTLTRRFRFQLMEFIPSLELSDHTGYNVSFGV